MAIMGQKKIGCPFFSISHEKINALMPIFFFKKRQFSINKQLSCPYFVKKDVQSLKNTAISCHFFKFLIKTPTLMPIICQKTSILSKLHHLMGHKSRQDALFYRFSRKIGCSQTHILSKIRLFSKKHIALKSMYCQKNVHSLKNTVLSCHFFQAFHEKPQLSRPYLVNKTLFL